jgi:starch synthase (maltosyl-transferring)
MGILPAPETFRTICHVGGENGKQDNPFRPGAQQSLRESCMAPARPLDTSIPGSGMPQRAEERAVAAGRRRVMIEGVQPELDCGRYPAKRTTGEPLIVEADIFTDGHDAISAVLLHRHERERRWRETPMDALGNDRWRARFTPDKLGRYQYTVVGWIDHFKSWRRDMIKRVEAGQDVSVDLEIGADLLDAAAKRAGGNDARRLRSAAETLRAHDNVRHAIGTALSDQLAELVSRCPDRALATEYAKVLELVVDPPRARFSAWYELFPRSTGEKGRHGTFRDVEKRLDYVAQLGFDTLYLPPVHPVGRTRRKGRNNAEIGEPDDVGSPWGIGAAEGGHKDVHPDLGTLDDFRRLVSAARAAGIDVALDIAFQVSPDHPYVAEHPEWFRTRPDGTIQYAENPPKKYQDIYPFDFETSDWKALWEELESIFLFWIDQGVRTFRVDNPHTKSFRFWEWCIDRIKRKHPDVVFLSEAFTRPRPMYRLAKLGFSQSYTYFAWRTRKAELIEYMTELTRTEVKDYFRPSFWPNTPDILTEQLQAGGRPMFMARLVLAATLTANYGIYGPAFELMEHVPREPGSEEYRDSEKYQLRSWDLDHPASLRHFISRVNRIRSSNPALHANESIRFHRIDNEHLLVYSKHTARPEPPPRPTGEAAGHGSHGAVHVPEEQPLRPDNLILVAVNLDPAHTHAGWVELPLADWGIDPTQSFEVHDLLGEARYTWRGAWNYIELNPHVVPAHIFRISLPE